ncbi:50S ribosomal protein L3 N(5)-glutamine methyltransferase [Marichromatium bheemlicum]|uniref:Ribosomal protein uL3 glutamine methyltransferase n=1 Tax=Marichromatium bheemlicum TaxID=365339 RepID=A0ABX1I7M5_9GAMM|nr:50S ribosomal protein L3 N(5)-glutamine methyltransferase [Marichromatium bheemlicum]NKN32220.1 50S ribosomal protein L3 N(5)-glutamine methyltransferase [Marichromatium bheemlicum]
MSAQPDGLITIQDFVRWGASRFKAAGLFFGHGTDNALDEAAELVLGALDLDHSLPAAFHTSRLTLAEREHIAALIEQRVAERVPVAYLTGRAWFAGFEFGVDRQVLVPRSPIAELLEVGFDPWIDPSEVSRVLDLCTGSGCIGIAAALYLPDAEVDLVDLSPAALAVARANVERYGLDERVRAIESDLFAALDGVCYDVIVSNPPYVPRDEYETLPAEFLREPELGLVAADAGLALALRILERAPAHLSEGGILVLEVGNSAAALEQRLPEVPFTWLAFERGGEGVLVLTREQLVAHRAEIAAALAA